jgi:hypothetical protein
MRYLTTLSIAALFVLTCSCKPQALVQRLFPVRLNQADRMSIQFGEVKPLSSLDSSEHVPGIMNPAAASKLAQRSFLLDTVGWDSSGRFWCRRVSLDGYTDVFRDGVVDENRLIKTKRLSDLQKLLGQPSFVVGPMDTEGTVLCQWRSLKHVKGKRFVACQVTCAIRSSDQAIRFLLSQNSTNVTEVSNSTL